MIIERTCEQCSKRIPDRAYQAPTVRTCSPECAGRLFRRENPQWAAKFERVEGGWEKPS